MQAFVIFLAILVKKIIYIRSETLYTHFKNEENYFLFNSTRVFRSTYLILNVKIIASSFIILFINIENR